MIRDSLARERPEVPLCKMGTTGLPIPQIGVGAWPTQKTTGSSWLPIQQKKIGVAVETTKKIDHEALVC